MLEFGSKFYMVLKVLCHISKDRDSDMERIELFRLWMGSWGLYHGKMNIGFDLAFLFLFLPPFSFFFLAEVSYDK